MNVITLLGQRIASHRIRCAKTVDRVRRVCRLLVLPEVAASIAATCGGPDGVLVDPGTQAVRRVQFVFHVDAGALIAVAGTRDQQASRHALRACVRSKAGYFTGRIREHLGQRRVIACRRLTMVLLGLSQHGGQGQLIRQITRVLHDVDFGTLLSSDGSWAPVQELLAAILNIRTLKRGVVETKITPILSDPIADFGVLEVVIFVQIPVEFEQVAGGVRRDFLPRGRLGRCSRCVSGRRINAADHARIGFVLFSPEVEKQLVLDERAAGRERRGHCVRLVGFVVRVKLVCKRSAVISVNLILRFRAQVIGRHGEAHATLHFIRTALGDDVDHTTG